jgi:predicted phosphoserine aminotransferase
MTHKRLWIPGPTEVSEDILLAQTRPMIGHREPEFTKLYSDIIDKLNKFFEITNYYTYVHTASGSIWMDIVARNLISNKALAATCGSFSERMFETIKGCDKPVDQIQVNWGKATKADFLLENLAKSSYDCLTVVHNETSTGVRNPTVEIGEKVKQEHPDIIYVIDAVSSLGGDFILPEKNKADLIFASSQKAFSLPPGLSMAFVSPAALEKAKTIKGRGQYTDLVELLEYSKKKKQTPSTPAISLLYALDVQLDKMLAEGHKNIAKRHEDMAKYTRAWAGKHGMKMYPEAGFESVTVSTIENTLGNSIDGLNKDLAPRNMYVSNGYSQIKEKTFRIGHMGQWTLSDLKELLWHIEDVWNL